MRARLALSALILLLAVMAVAPARAQDARMLLQSPDFSEGAPLPDAATCHAKDKGAGLSPALAWQGLPAGTRSLALTVIDPDAPAGPFTHWLVWGIDPAQTGLDRGIAADARGLTQGVNGFGALGYGGACPPAGHGPHHYIFTLYALDAAPALQQGAQTGALLQAIDGHILAATRLVGIYEVP